MVYKVFEYNSSEQQPVRADTLKENHPKHCSALVLLRRLLQTVDMILNWSVPTNTSALLQPYYCEESHMSYSPTAFLITRTVLVVPFATWVLHLGHQRWRQSSVKLMRHCDVITYHMAVMQLTEAPGLVLYLMGYVAPSLTLVGFSVSSLAVVGEMLFHVLTCVERYLAVVHPLTYLKLKNTSGVIIRDVCIAAVWFFSLAWGGLIISYFPAIPFTHLFCLSSLGFAVVSFCSLSVLRVLVLPKPAVVSGDRGDRAKIKAFKTIMAITGALWLMFFGYFVCFALKVSSSLSYTEWCFIVACVVWFSLPSSLVVPLLFLYRVEKTNMFCCANDA